MDNRQPMPGNRRRYEIVHPNQAKASSKVTKLIVVLILLASVVLSLIVTIGGWSKLEGMKPVQIGIMLIYLLMAFLVARWRGGVLPVAAGLGTVVGIFAAVSVADWFQRDREGFATPETPFGSEGLAPTVLGTITFLIVIVQLLLIVFAMQGFRQNWNVEEERPLGDHHDEHGYGQGGPGYGATAPA